MNQKLLVDLIEEGENIHCEFKRHFTTPEKIAKEMIAFANTKGGYILFGIDDDRTIIGVESEKSEAEMIEDAAKNHCEPQIEHKLNYISYKGKEIVAVTLPVAPDFLPEIYPMAKSGAVTATELVKMSTSRSLPSSSPLS